MGPDPEGSQDGPPLPKLMLRLNLQIDCMATPVKQRALSSHAPCLSEVTHQKHMPDFNNRIPPTLGTMYSIDCNCRQFSIGKPMLMSVRTAFPAAMTLNEHETTQRSQIQPHMCKRIQQNIDLIRYDQVHHTSTNRYMPSVADGD